MVEIFRTNVMSADASEMLLGKLSAHLPGCRLNFDLDDCDKILRAEGEIIDAAAIIGMLQADGFECELLD